MFDFEIDFLMLKKCETYIAFHGSFMFNYFVLFTDKFVVSFVNILKDKTCKIFMDKMIGK